MNHQLLSENIEKYVDSLDLKNKAYSILDNIKKEYQENEELIDGYSIDEMIFKFERHEITIGADNKVNSVIARIGIFINDLDKVWINDLKPIGYYDYEVTFEGEFLDDFFVIKETKVN